MPKPRVFVGSSSESREIVDALESELREVATIERWDVDVFRPGHYTLEELLTKVKHVDFAIFVLGQDDMTESRGKPTPSPRDNVIFEAGLFTAVLGTEKTFYVVSKAGTKVPTDWLGLGYTEFDPTEDRPRDKVYDAVRQIRPALSEWRPQSHLGPLSAIVGQWWQVVVNTDSGAVISKVEITASDAHSPVLDGIAWSANGKELARYTSQSARFDEGNRTLHYSWEGHHPREEAIPRYFGIGEIRFRATVGQPANEGEGWFSTSRLGDVKDTLTKSVEYTRIGNDEMLVIESEDRDEMEALILRKLNER